MTSWGFTDPVSPPSTAGQSCPQGSAGLTTTAGPHLRLPPPPGRQVSNFGQGTVAAGSPGPGLASQRPRAPFPRVVEPMPLPALPWHQVALGTSGSHSLGRLRLPLRTVGAGGAGDPQASLGNGCMPGMGEAGRGPRDLEQGKREKQGVPGLGAVVDVGGSRTKGAHHGLPHQPVLPAKPISSSLPAPSAPDRDASWMTGTDAALSNRVQPGPQMAWGLQDPGQGR